MVHSSKANNYKAKWLSALDQRVDAPKIAASSAEKDLSAVKQASVDATFAFNKIQHATLEAASVARSLNSVMSDFQTVAGVDYGDTTHEIDNKLNDMPLPVILRRMRDIMKLAETRIGILSVASEETHEAYQTVLAEIKRMKPGLKPLDESLMQTTYIGLKPSLSEIEDFKDNKDGSYHRHDILYEDLDNDWFDTRLGTNTIMRQPVPHLESDNKNDSSDEEEDSVTERQVVSMSRRAVEILPSSVSKKSAPDNFGF